jgi:hypothetical protein
MHQLHRTVRGHCGDQIVSRLCFRRFQIAGFLANPYQLFHGTEAVKMQLADN